MWPALLPVGIEQGVGRAVPQHRQQFPGEVGHVPDAGIQTLAEKRRHLVCRVAGNEDAPAPPVPCDDGVEAIHRMAPDFVLLDRGVQTDRLDDAAAVLEPGRVLARQQFQLPAAQVSRPDHVADRTGWPAIMAAHRRHRLRVVHQGIDHHPAFVEIEIFHGAADDLADHAAGAVAADDIARVEMPEGAGSPRLGSDTHGAPIGL